MISYVAKLLNLFTLTIQTSLDVASFIGQVIVFLVTEILSRIWSIIKSIILFLQIVYEDNTSVFTDQVPSFANDVINTISNQLLQIENGAVLVYNDTINIITSSVKAVFIVVWEVTILFKNSLIFLGDTLWFILTFIPVQLPLLLKAFLKLVTDIIINAVIDAYMALLKVTNFLTDVPLQSFIGIVSAIIIVRLCIYFRDDIESHISEWYWLLTRKLLYLYYVLYNYFTDSDVRMITRMASGHEMEARQIDTSPVDIDAVDAADALCVICQERQKCVLTLPCRHVCLCIECCLRLYGYQRTCPICRTFIYHSVTVYL